MRVAVIFTCFSKTMSVGYVQGQYFLNTAFVYNQEFEVVLKK